MRGTVEVTCIVAVVTKSLWPTLRQAVELGRLSAVIFG